MSAQVSNAKLIQAINQVLDRGEVVALATVIQAPQESKAQPGAKLLVWPQGRALGSLEDPALDERVVRDCQRVFAQREPMLLTYPAPAGGELHVFVEPIEGAPTMLIVGGGHIAQHLAKVGKMVGFRLVVLDDRPAFANRERFPEADQVIAANFVPALQTLPIHPNTYVVIVTRGHQHDEDALRQVIGSDAAYIGMIGSTRKVCTILARLKAEGVLPQAIERVHAPIGLNIGAQTPEEIAVSIVAEVINVRRGGPAETLSMRRRYG